MMTEAGYLSYILGLFTTFSATVSDFEQFFKRKSFKTLLSRVSCATQFFLILGKKLVNTQRSIQSAIINGGKILVMSAQDR